MKLIESKAEYIPQENGLEGVYKQIEICGRTCYKSTDKITEGSAKPFVDRMIASKHTAMLEQGTVYLRYPEDEDFARYFENPYSKIKLMGNGYFAVTTNLRVLVENGWLDDLKYLCNPTEHHEKRYTFRFITDRGVSHELVRHRVFSFAQESTRYCNYSKDKFGAELTFIKPYWLDENSEDMLVSHLIVCEKLYLNMLDGIEQRGQVTMPAERKFTPQEARQVLPNALKTEVCMTGFASDWRFFFDLRYFGTTGKPHPDMELLAEKAMIEAKKAGIWESIIECPSKFN